MTTASPNDTFRQASERFTDAMNSWISACTSTWMGAWRHGADTMLRPMASRGTGEAGNAAHQTDAARLGFGALPASFVEALTPLRRQTSAFLREMADLGASGSAELASLGGDQARFMARLADRGLDCAVGPQPARSPEAFMATAQSMSVDVAEHATTVAERLCRLGAASMERTSGSWSRLLGQQLAAQQTCCGGDCSSTGA